MTLFFCFVFHSLPLNPHTRFWNKIKKLIWINAVPWVRPMLQNWISTPLKDQYCMSIIWVAICPWGYTHFMLKWLLPGIGMCPYFPGKLGFFTISLKCRKVTVKTKSYLYFHIFIPVCGSMGMHVHPFSVLIWGHYCLLWWWYYITAVLYSRSSTCRMPICCLLLGMQA